MSAHDPLTFAGLIEHWAKTEPDFSVLTIEGAGVRDDDVRTYGQLWDKGRSLAVGLNSLGIGKGARIGTLLANHAEFVDLMVACSLLGAVLVPIDPRTKGSKLSYMVTAAGCTGIVAADYALPEILSERDQLHGLRWLVGLQTDEGKATTAQLHAAGVRPYGEIAYRNTEGAYFPGANPEDTLELIYTSGTTGDPKGIVMTHRRYCETSAIVPRVFGFTRQDRLYTGLSLTHANAQLVTLGAGLANGIPCVLSRRFTKSRLWDITRQYQCTSFSLLGGMTTAIYAEPPKANDADNPVRVVVSAGMPVAIWNDFKCRFNVELIEWYGAAEGGLTFNPPGIGPVGSIGKPVPTFNYRIVDDAGNDVPKNENSDRIGELFFQPKDGSPYKVEYFGNPEASEKKCAGGWLHMGDVVREDKDNWLFFLFRKGSGIRRNGDFVNSAFIEKVIAEAEDVDDVYVYGIPAANGVPGEKDVVAAVVPRGKTPCEFDAQTLFKRCREKLEANFVPSFIQVLQEIPKTASEKPQDRFLIEALEITSSSVHQEAR